MKVKRFNLTQLGVLLLSMLSVVAASKAATTHPLNSPQGLALDSKGNLYVANNLGNQVLVYNPT